LRPGIRLEGGSYEDEAQQRLRAGLGLRSPAEQDGFYQCGEALSLVKEV